MKRKIKGKWFSFELNDAGKVVNDEYSVEADTLDEALKEVTAKITKEKTGVKIKVWFSPHFEHEYRLGQTTGDISKDYWKSVWVTWRDEKGYSHREKKSAAKIYLDTPENREALATLKRLVKESEVLEEQIGEIQRSLTSLS